MLNDSISVYSDIEEILTYAEVYKNSAYFFSALMLTKRGVIKFLEVFKHGK